MAVHLIKLRKAWDCEDLTTKLPSSKRLDLPLSCPLEIALPGRFRLIRTFAAPRLTSGQEALSIRLEQVEGLRSLFLNDQAFPVPEPLPDSFEIEVTEPLSRNRLVLEVEFDLGGLVVSTEKEGWGRIALVISPVETL